MTTIDYTLTPDQLSNVVDNTTRVFNEYSLRKKTDSEVRQLINYRHHRADYKNGQGVHEKLKSSCG